MGEIPQGLVDSEIGEAHQIHDQLVTDLAGIAEVKDHERIKFEGVGAFQGVQVDHMGAHAPGRVMGHALVDGAQAEHHFGHPGHGHRLLQEQPVTFRHGGAVQKREARQRKTSAPFHAPLGGYLVEIHLRAAPPQADAVVVVASGVRVMVTVGAEWLEGFQAASEAGFAQGFKIMRVQGPGAAAFPLRQQSVAVLNDAGVGGVGRWPADVSQNAARGVVAETAFFNAAGGGFGPVFGGAHETVAVVGALFAEGERVHHAVAVEPVAEGPPAQLGASGADAQKGAAYGVRYLAAYFAIADPQANFAIQVFEAPAVIRVWMVVHKKGPPATRVYAVFIQEARAGHPFSSVPAPGLPSRS